MEQKCPYCEYIFNKKFQRCSTCSQCNKKFYVYQGKLITDKQKLKNTLMFEMSWLCPSIEKSIDNLIDTWGSDRKLNDYRFSLFNEAILLEKAKHQYSHQLKVIYLRMISCLQEEGIDIKHVYKLAEEQIIKYGEIEWSALSPKERKEMADLEIKNLRSRI